MTQTEMFDFVTKLYDCSKYMREINEEFSNVLLEMASEMVNRLESSVLPEEVKRDIEDIKSELLDD